MLYERIVAGDIRAAARLMRRADDREPSVRRELAGLFPHTGRAHVIGITGNPGAGKSTLVDMVVKDLRDRGKRVGVVAIDPSSPFTGGAILGDRIRMQRHAEDPDVFIRSLATRGHLGGLTRSTGDVVTILDAMGFDAVIIETVGVGQDEVDIVKTAHTSVVVLVPGMGDEIQIMKAGILEIADIFVVNKADRPGAERVLAELETLQQIVCEREEDRVPVLKTVAPNNVGIRELGDALVNHIARLSETGERERRDAVRFRETIHSIVREATQARFIERYREYDARQNVSSRLQNREVSPYDIAEQLLDEMLVGGNGG
jgi:LAO/AO transport system kinase